MEGITIYDDHDEEAVLCVRTTKGKCVIIEATDDEDGHRVRLGISGIVKLRDWLNEYLKQETS